MKSFGLDCSLWYNIHPCTDNGIICIPCSEQWHGTGLNTNLWGDATGNTSLNWFTSDKYNLLAAGLKPISNLM